MDKWNSRFLDIAKLVASFSKDPSTKCGAVIVRPDKTVASMGFNGFPKGCDDSPALYEDRDQKYSRVVHAEQNAIIHAGESVKGYTLYTWPPGFGPSCDRCSAHIIQAGIKRVVHYKDESNFASRWKESSERGLRMYDEAGVEVISYPLSEEYPTLVMHSPDEEVKEHDLHLGQGMIWDDKEWTT